MWGDILKIKDDNNMHNTKEIQEKLVIIGIDNGRDAIFVEDSLNELEELIETAGAIVIGRMVQKRDKMHNAHYFGKGKIEELKAYVEELGATGVVCDDELTPSQMKNMYSTLNVKIMNRTLVILDIFASRATSAEGKLQVELAQLKYKLTHLVGQGKDLSRQGGGIGTRGPGEKKLETDRRNVDDRISELSKELKNIERHRQIMREKRLKNKQPIVAFVGYTNAGKSTLMNKLTNSNILAMDKLFATLDTTTRKLELPSGREYLFTDTVGFIQKLPHNLIKAFRATLEETKYADILVHVVDSSNCIREEQMKVVYDTLRDLDCVEKPIITVYNKIDKNTAIIPLPEDNMCSTSLRISAKTGIGLDELLDDIENIIKSSKKSMKLLIPYQNSNIIGVIHGRCEIIENDNKEDGMYFEIFADEEMESKLSEFVIK